MIHVRYPFRATLFPLCAAQCRTAGRGVAILIVFTPAVRYLFKPGQRGLPVSPRSTTQVSLSCSLVFS
jgi:hypothetical protein